MRRVVLLRTPRKRDVDALVARYVPGVKPHKKSIFVATYTTSASDGSAIMVEVKQKADDAFRAATGDPDPAAVFDRLLSAKYAITKAQAVGARDTFDIIKTTKRECMRDIGGAIDRSRVHFAVEERAVYTAATAVLTVVSVGKDAFTVYVEAPTAADVNAFVVVPAVAGPKKSKTKSASPGPDPAAEWVLPNRAGFAKWMYKRFNPDVYAVPEEQSSQLKLFPHQRLVRDVMQFHSPFRGILLYHGLGVGKTCASIAAAEGFLQRHKKVFVLVPASLAQNYKNEILRCASIGNPKNKMWNIARLPSGDSHHPDVKRVMEAYGLPHSLVKKHHVRLWLPSITDGVTFIRRDMSWDSLNEEEQAELTSYMQEYVDTKYTFISYNGITGKGVDALGKDPFDDAFIVMDEAHNFVSRVTNGGKIARRLFNLLMNSKRSKMIMLSGTPVINHPFELSVLLNLVRGPTTMWTYHTAEPAPSQEAIVQHLMDQGVLKYVDIIRVSGENAIDLQLLPLNFVRGEGHTVGHGRWQTDEAGMEARVRAALASLVKLEKKTPLVQKVYALPDSKEDFEKMFLDESDPDNPVIKHTDLFMRRILGMVSYFRTAGEEYFPTVLPTIHERVPMSPYQFSHYVDVRDEERRMELRNKRDNAVSGGVFGKKGTVYRAFSRMACNFVFPEHIKRPFPGQLRKELAKEISQNEEDRAAAEDEEADAENIDKKVQKEYETQLKKAMAALRAEDAPLALKKLHDMYSPKFAKMTQTIMESPGSCLLYSQFRTVEGLGVMRLVLEEAGFVEIDVHKHDGEWVIVRQADVLDPKYDGKRFVVFNEDREKTNILIRIFNGALADLPPSIAQPLRAAGHAHNLRGDLARVLMISQSGAEGISLKNVRRVIISEPFWNRVRIDQVIGRAVRTQSHADLPADERNVQVFMYSAMFTPQQLKDNFTLQRLDRGQTSDEHIFEIAEHKSRIINQFLNMLKRAALDCANNAAQNRLMSEASGGLQCYAFPVNMKDGELAYQPTLADEQRQLKKTKLERTRRIRGRVVVKDGKRMVEVEGLPGLYDYRAYKDGGILLAAN